MQAYPSLQRFAGVF